jgi:hypothetical protein
VRLALRAAGEWSGYGKELACFGHLTMWVDFFFRFGKGSSNKQSAACQRRICVSNAAKRMATCPEHVLEETQGYEDRYRRNAWLDWDV